MATPSKKAPAIEHMLDNLSQRNFGRSRTESITANICVSCGSNANLATDFRNLLSIKEYSISGLCQVCQDRVFGKD